MFIDKTLLTKDSSPKDFSTSEFRLYVSWFPNGGDDIIMKKCILNSEFNKSPCQYEVSSRYFESNFDMGDHMLDASFEGSSSFNIA